MATTDTFFLSRVSLLMPIWAKKQLVAGSGDETSRSRVFDIARGLDWPAPYTGRAFRNAFADAWDGREEALRASAEVREQFTLGHQAGDPQRLGHRRREHVRAGACRRDQGVWPGSFGP
jgi:hypothetical protein